MMRQRLVGALVLLCLGVIVWSLLFTGSADYKVDRTSQIPEPPRIEPLIEREPQVPEGVPTVAERRIEPQPTLEPQDVEGGEGVRAAAVPPLVEADESEVVAKSRPESTKPVQQAGRRDEPELPGLDDNGLPKAWVVQVGSFGSQANAEALVKRLKARGYKAFQDQVNSGGRRLYRVQVGPLLDEARAREMQAEINQNFQVKSIVNRFEG